MPHFSTRFGLPFVMVVALLGVAQGSKDIGEDAACKAPACCDAKAIFPHKKELVFTDHSRAEIPEGCTTIDVGLGKIGQDTGAGAIAEALKENTAVTELIMYNTDIGLKGATALAEMLKVNTGVRNLNLDNNKIGNKGLIAISKALTTNTRLTNLDLVNNNIKKKGFIALALNLSEINLEYLNLDSNKAKNEGAAAIAAVLKDNTALKTLDMSGNDIGDEGALAFADALKGMSAGNSALKTLKLDGHVFKESTKSELAEAFASNPQLEILKVQGIRKMKGTVQDA